MSTGIAKVHGGVKTGFWTEGAVSFYTLTVIAGITTDIIATDGVTVVPDSGIDKLVQVISTRANVIGVEYTEGGTSVLVALTRSAWGADTLQTAIQALGATVVLNRFDGSDAIITATVSFAAVTVATSADFVGAAVATEPTV